MFPKTWLPSLAEAPIQKNDVTLACFSDSDHEISWHRSGMVSSLTLLPVPAATRLRAKAPNISARK